MVFYASTLALEMKVEYQTHGETGVQLVIGTTHEVFQLTGLGVTMASRTPSVMPNIERVGERSTISVALAGSWKSRSSCNSIAIATTQIIDGKANEHETRVVN